MGRFFPNSASDMRAYSKSWSGEPSWIVTSGHARIASVDDGANAGRTGDKDRNTCLRRMCDEDIVSGGTIDQNPTDSRSSGWSNAERVSPVLTTPLLYAHADIIAPRPTTLPDCIESPALLPFDVSRSSRRVVGPRANPLYPTTGRWRRVLGVASETTTLSTRNSDWRSSILVGSVSGFLVPGRHRVCKSDQGMGVESGELGPSVSPGLG